MRTSKILLLVLSALIILLLLGFAGYRGYHTWRERRWMNLAREFVAQSDDRSAVLSFQQVLRVNPRNVEACRKLADLHEAANSPAALLWRQRVVDLAPRSAEDRLALSRTALVLRDMAIATNALQAISGTTTNTAAFHNVAGSIAGALGDLDLAALHFQQAARLEPENPTLQINLASLQVHHTNAAVRTAALADLRTLSANPAVRVQALRELTADALRGERLPDALHYSQQLAETTNAAFRDRVLHLDVLRQSRSPDLAATLASVQRDAASSPTGIAEVARWQLLHTPVQDVLQWLVSLPDAVRTNSPANIIIAECQATLRDWDALHDTLAGQNWAELEFVRHAYLVLAERGRGRALPAKAEWELAMKQASQQRGSLNMLLQLVLRWRWPAETEEILWTMVNRFPEEKWAVTTLSQALYLDGRTRPLLTLLNQEARRDPGNLSARNNLAMTALLLEASELRVRAEISLVY